MKYTEKQVDIQEGIDKMKVVRVTRTEFEMEDGSVHQIDPPLPREMSIGEFERHIEAARKVVSRSGTIGGVHAGDPDVGREG